MKIFISQPMKDKTEEQIRSERAVVVDKLKQQYGDDIEVLDSIIKPDKKIHSLVYLGRSIEILAQADLAYFMEGWDEHRGCIIEYLCADRYGIQIEEEV